MAEKESKETKQIKAEKKAEKAEAKAEKARQQKQEEDRNETLVRIYGYDIPGSRKVFVGLTYIKGISWALSNILCIKLGIKREKRILELSKPEIHEIEEFIKSMPVPDFMKNRRKDMESGESKHFLGSDLDMRKEFDIKRLKEIKSYRGIRHASKLPSRGQRTRSHFRSKSAASTMKMRKKVA